MTLERSGHDVAWSAEWPRDPGDVEILAIALRERRILVTLDKDFGELAVVHELPHGGILRLVGLRAMSQGPACQEALARYGTELGQGAIVTVEPTAVVPH